MLVICSITDIKKKCIYIIPCLLLAGAGLLWQILQGNNMIEITADLLPGILALLFSRWSEEELGAGDAVILLMLGIWLGFMKCVEIFLLALGVVVVFVIPVFWVKKISLKTPLPFIPFVTVSFIMIFLQEVV